MILVGGGGVLLVLLVLFGMTALVVMVPLALFRTARSSIRVLQPDEWPRERYERQVPASGWDSPRQPVLPPVGPADVTSLRDRLGHDVRSLDPGTDAVSRQAMADASERYDMAGTLLERARSDAQLRTAWLAAVEGLVATRVVRRRLGLDLGPPLPELPTTGPQLSQPSRVEIDGQSHLGGPSYEPGRPHWFPGGHYDGRQVPGGWYDAPFWPGAVLLGGLGGLGGLALGGLLAGSMFGAGFDGDWVDGGGGDWSDAGGGGFGGFGGFDSGGDLGEGGDFGGFGGGGDFGGGGGDW